MTIDPTGLVVGNGVIDDIGELMFILGNSFVPPPLIDSIDKFERNGLNDGNTTGEEGNSNSLFGMSMGLQDLEVI